MVLHKGVASRDLAPFPSHDLIYNRLWSSTSPPGTPKTTSPRALTRSFRAPSTSSRMALGRLPAQRRSRIPVVADPVKDHVHSGINAGILHASIGGYVGVPLSGIAADKVVRFLEQLVRPADLRGRICFPSKRMRNGSHRAGAGSVAKSPRSREAMPGRQIM